MPCRQRLVRAGEYPVPGPKEDSQALIGGTQAYMIKPKQVRGGRQTQAGDPAGDRPWTRM